MRRASLAISELATLDLSNRSDTVMIGLNSNSYIRYIRTLLEIKIIYKYTDQI